MIASTYQPADIIAAAERAAGGVLPAVPVGHRGIWQYQPGRRQLLVKVTHPAVGVTLRLKTPLIRRLINQDFPGAVAKITVKIGLSWG